MSFRKNNSSDKILHDEYFGEQPSAAFLLTVRLVLLCVMSASLIMIFCELYEYAGNELIPAGIAAIASGVIYILASLFPSVLVYGAVITASGAVIWILRDRVYQYALNFWDYMMLRLDSRLLHTSGFMVQNMRHLDPVKMQQAFFWTAIALAVLCSVLFTAAVRTRLHLSVPIAAATIITAPAVASETAGYIPIYLMFVVCIFGFEAVASSYELDSGFIYGSLSSAHLSDHRNDREYGRRALFASPKQKVAGDTVRFHRYSGNMITMAAVTALVFFGASSLIPEGKGLNYQEVFDTLSDVGTRAADTVGDILGISFGTADDRGYFSSDSYGDISDSISLQPPSESNRPVLEVTLSRNDIPVYLRGDIGVDYTGNSWTSITSAAARYKELVPEEFYPEAEYQVFRRLLTAEDNKPDNIIPLQMVSVKYLRNTRVVFQPLAAYELNYKTNSFYDYFGDFILRTKRGFVNNYEGLSLTPDIGRNGDLSAIAAAGLAEQLTVAYLSDHTISAPDMSNEYYLSNIDAYRGFIEETYKKSDPAISDFMTSVTSADPALQYGNPLSDYAGEANRRYNAAMSLCDYFSKNFTYSLNAENGEDQFGSFLYETHKGHCALFATAMTLALRDMNIPARYVTGYVVYGGGEADKDGNYRYTLTEKELHAWTEVYFRGIGWLPFDPTAAVPGYAEIVYNGEDIVPDRNPDTTTSVPSVTSAPEPDTTTAPESQSDLPDDTTQPPESDPLSEDDTDASGSGSGIQPDRHSAGSAENLFVTLLPYIVIAAVAAAVIAVIAMFVRNLKKAEKRTIKSFRTLPPYEACALMYRFVMTLLEKKGLVPGCEQFYDFAERVDGSIEMKGTNVFMMDVMPVFEKCEFGSADIAPVSEDERDAVCRFTAAVYRRVVSEESALKRFFMKISLFL